MKMNAFLQEHGRLTRRYFLKAGLLSGISSQFGSRSVVGGMADNEQPQGKIKPEKAGAFPEPYFTPSEFFRDVSRGDPLPHSLSEEEKREAGLTRETWSLEVISDPDHPVKLDKPLSKANHNAFDFPALLKLGEKHAVRFPKVMTCLNLGCPLGMGLWEGVPLREILWLTRPREDLRRVFYYGFHNNDPKQMFRSSLPISRVWEDPFDLPPVILCYKLNGQWLDAERGGPVRVVVPEDYGFKSIKWLTHLVLTNLATANDTYADQGNDVDSPMKTFAATLSIPKEVKAGKSIPVSGYAQVGVSGLSRVQVSFESSDKLRPENDPYFTLAPWKDAVLLGVPKTWTGLAEGRIPPNTHGFDFTGKPKYWPMRFTNSHWATILPPVEPGNYTFRCRTIDEKGNAQPMPRPFRNSGHSKIESLSVKVVA